MLVLGRKIKETISFPELDISVEILSSNNSKVRVGVDAPLEIKVIRGELSDSISSGKIHVHSDSEHGVRNILNELTIATGLTRKLIELGKTGFAAKVLNKALCEIESKREASLVVSNSQPPTKATVLLVEDVDNERELLAGFLNLHGYETVAVSDGEACLSYMEDHELPDYILMDMNLPKFNGAETIRRLRESSANNSIAIFAVSGSTPKSSGVNVTKNRIAHWFQKPLNPLHLIKELDRQLN